MPQVKFAASAITDLKRLQEFLRPKNPAASKRAASAIINAINSLKQYPLIGRPSEDMDYPGFRELLIEFGDSGYVALYQYSPDTVVVTAIKHQKEMGY